MYINEEARHQRETIGNMRLGNPKSLEIIKLNNYRTDATYAKGSIQPTETEKKTFYMQSWGEKLGTIRDQLNELSRPRKPCVCGV